ncbi:MULTISPECIES: ABC transporter ATP-binding protein [Bacillus]|uniref:ABC transporter n=2 Tax=Bacillus TaxID=1386 RepID=A0A0M3R9W0_9BACI|nr:MULTISPECIES: ABC transporter ATP-binding protein [Bacillus]ALC82122.1 ABC transporter [Bacillus gobiensis]MBP1084242.1 ABC-2 type transport system ATP-binding protein [Bacillus capparidis]MED1095634.1 ABC transporter ATP-binding protein [Bacillus capparidis]
MLTIENLTKTYKNNVTAVKDFNITVKPAEIVAVAGPNGSGKTSMINCILGIIKQNKGNIMIGDLTNEDASFKKKLAYVPDDLLLPEALTGKEYLDFILSMYECNSIQKRNQLIELFDMKKALSEPIETYSHGMKKKIQLIAAFMLDSTIIIMDEPFRGLDIEAVINTKKLMKRYTSNNGAILLSTHDMLAAEELCNRIAIISKGHKMDEGTTAHLKEKYGCSTLEQVFLKASMLSDRGARFDEIINNF